MKKDIEFQSDDVRIYRGTVTADGVDTDELIEYFEDDELIDELKTRGYTVSKED